MKKGLFHAIVLLLSLVVVFLTIPPSSTLAASAGTSFVIDGNLFAGPTDEPSPYINKDQRTMVPIRFFAEALGVPNDEDHIAWDQELKTAIIVKDNTIIYIPPGKRYIIVNGQHIAMDTVAEIKDQRVFIPARFLAEALDCNVQWDDANQRVIIFTPEYLENHQAMKTGRLLDINDPWIIDAFYEKWQSKVNVARYGSPETLRKHITEAREIASGIKIVDDPEKEVVTITYPNYDKEDYLVALDSNKGNELTPYPIQYNEAPENGRLFIIRISDRNHGGYILYMLFGFMRDGKLQMVEGTIGQNMFDGEG